MCYWAGKLLPELIGSENVVRFPIIISRGHIEKLHQVPAFENEIGRERSR